jgi:hypothetical protein
LKEKEDFGNSRPFVDVIETAVHESDTGEHEVLASITERLETTRQELEHSGHWSEESRGEEVFLRESGLVGWSELSFLVKRIVETRQKRK